MIRLTRLDGKAIVVNERNIQWVEALPDTSIAMLGGSRIIVRESVDEVASAVRAELNVQSAVPLPSRAATTAHQIQSS